MNRDEIARACMIRTASRGLWAASKLMDIERAEIARRSGFTEEELADIEEGREQLTAKGYIALAAFFDSVFESGKCAGDAASVRKLLDTNYSDRDIPKYYAENLRKVFSGMNFLQRWFASFDDVVNQLQKASDEKFTDGELTFIAENYNVFVDSSAVKHEKFAELLSRLKSCTGNVFITRESFSELEDCDDVISMLSQEEAVSVFEAEGTVKEVFEESIKNRFFFITCDEKLAYEILNSPVQDIRKAPVLAAYICTDGNIALYDKDDLPPEEAQSQEQDDTEEHEDTQEDEADEYLDGYEVEDVEADSEEEPEQQYDEETEPQQ